jgi:hypothetical protein
LRGFGEGRAGVSKVSLVYACTFEKQNHVFLRFHEAWDSLHQEVEDVVRVVEVVSHDKSRNPEATIGSARSQQHGIMTSAITNVNPLAATSIKVDFFLWLPSVSTCSKQLRGW